MLCATTPDFSVRYILFLNVPVKILEWSDGIGFTSWLTFRLSLDFIIWNFSSGLAVSICGFIPPPISPSLASSCFPVTCTDLTWEGDCSTVGWLQLLFWVCRPGVTLSSYKWLLPSVTDPTQGLCFRICLSLYQELLVFITFSLIVPQSRKASFQLLSAPGFQAVQHLGRFHQICLWTAVFNEDLLRIFEHHGI